MEKLSLKQLRYFDALAHEGHFGRAAERCAVTQPALSMQIQELERAVGVTLVERTRQGARLTAEGEEIARRTARILADLRDLVDHARHSDRLLSGPLRLGVIPTIAPYLLPPLLPRLRSEHPDLELSIRETQTDMLVEELVGGRLDLLLLALPVENREVETLALFEDRFLLATPPDWSLSGQAMATPEMLESDRVLLLEEGHCLREQALTYCSLQQVSDLDTYGASSLSTVVQMVANGMGVTLLPEMTLDLEAARGDVRLLRFAEPQPSRTIGLAWRRSTPRTADFEAFGALVASLKGSSGKAKAAPGKAPDRARAR